MRRALITVLTAGAVALVSLCLPAAAAAAVTLTSPAPGAVFTNGQQPTFAGSANALGGQVTIDVYAGSSVGTTPVEAVQATPSAINGSYSAPASPPLANGQYTARASQAGPLGAGSPPVTFTMQNPLPVVTLDSPAGSPFLTPTPTLTGTAGTARGDSQVAVAIFAGTDTTKPPVESVAAPVNGSTGRFAVTVTPGLSDGEYTAIAGQSSAAGTAVSAPQTFRVKVNAPAVSLSQPAAGASLTDPRPVFAGAAGDTAGDGGQVTVTLYAGGSPSGQKLGSVTTTRSGASWALRWPSALAGGSYTAQASQGDDVGHTGVSSPVSFVIVSPRGTIGAAVKLSRRTVSVAVKCALPPGASCQGTVLIVTLRRFRPLAGGPSGPLRLLFSYLSLPAGKRVTVSGRLPGPLARALHSAHTVKVRVSVALGLPGGSPSTVSATRRLRRAT